MEDINMEVIYMFIGQKHKKRFLDIINELNKNDRYFSKKFLSALYVITSDEFLWNISKKHINHNHIDFKSINIRGINNNSYQLLQFSKGILLENEMLIQDIIDRKLYNDKNFKIIIDAIKIARKGLNLN